MLKTMTQTKKSQSALEFIIFAFTLFFFMTLFFLALEESTADKVRDEKKIAFENVAFIIQDEITLATDSVNGYERKFNLPSSINDLDYSATITEGYVYVRSVDGKYALALPVQNVTGQISKGQNVLRKQGGIVYLTNN